MTRPADLPLPNWPAVMDTPMAALYLALSEASFRGVATRAGIRPVDLGLSLTRWRRADLDTLVDRLPPRGADVEAAADSLDTDQTAAALDRVRQRRG